MTEAERRAAWEAAVTKALEAQSQALNTLAFQLAARVGIPYSMGDIWAAVANARAMHEAVIDEPGQYIQDIPAERMTGDSVTVEPIPAAKGGADDHAD